jgi:hypothetical protein
MNAVDVKAACQVLEQIDVGLPSIDMHFPAQLAPFGVHVAHHDRFSNPLRSRHPSRLRHASSSSSVHPRIDANTYPSGLKAS